MTSKTKADDGKRRPDARELEAQIAKLTDIAARAQADLQNFKARQEKNAGELAKFAVAPLLLELLPVRDDLARAEAHGNDAEGIGNIIAKFDGVLEKAGLKKIEALGIIVDPSRHEVISAAPGEKNVVLEVHEDGYEFHGRLLRPAKVVAGEGTSGEQEGPSGTAASTV